MSERSVARRVLMQLGNLVLLGLALIAIVAVVVGVIAVLS